MRYIRLCFLFSICLIFLSCKQEKEESRSTLTAEKTKDVSISNKDNFHIDRKVVIEGNSKESRPLQNMAIIDYSYFFGENHKNLTKTLFKEEQDSVKIIIPDLKEPQIIEMLAIGDDNFYNSRWLVSPGDSLSFKIKDGNLIFSGKNASHYNFFSALDPTSSEWSKNGYNGNLKEYKKRSADIYKRRKEYFHDYIEKHPSVSEEFKQQVEGELRFEYLYNLIAPRSIKSKFEDNYINDLNGIIYTLSNQSSPNENLINFPDYFDNVTIEDFNQPQLINNDYFKRSLVAYIRFYFTQNEFLDYSEKNFKNELKYIQDNLKEEMKLYAIGRLINDYYQKGFGQGEHDRELLKKQIASYKEENLTSSYIDMITEIEQDLKLSNTEVPEIALDEKLINLSGDTLALKDVFELTGKKMKVINFLGPLCPPCETDIKESKTFKKNLEFRKNLEFIYISVIDYETNEEWKKRSKSLESQFGTKYQYKMVNAKRSKFLEFLKVRDKDAIIIPKYSMISTQGKVLFNNLPKPSDSMAFKKAVEGIWLQ